MDKSIALRNSLDMETLADIIRLWPSDADFAVDVGVKLSRVRVWRHRRFIPPEFWAGIEQAAYRRNIIGASASDLAKLASNRRAPAKEIAA
jgi:hypothetical protein